MPAQRRIDEAERADDCARDHAPTHGTGSLAANLRRAFLKEGGAAWPSCKRSTEGLYLNVSVLCRHTVSAVTVIWEPLSPERAVAAPADTCGD